MGRLVDRRIDADEIPGLFARSSAVVLPYTDATQSGVVAMAFGFGRPAIVTNVGGLPDVICDGYNGLLVAPKDAGALAEAISRLIVNDDLRNRLTAGASDYGSTELSWEFVARQTSAVYDSAIVGRGRHPKQGCSGFAHRERGGANEIAAGIKQGTD